MSREAGEGAVATQEVPAGLERLLRLAAADAEFAEALLSRRADTVAASGVALTTAEEAVLAATSVAALGQLVAGVGGALGSSSDRGESQP